MGLPPGTTTDDTAMARNLARSLIEREGFDPADVTARHLAWFESDPPDVGSLTAKVFRRVADGTPAEQAAREIWEERGPEVSAGNGSVMYCAPLGVAYASRPAELRDLAPRLSALTHFDQRCRTACLSICLAIAALVRGETTEVALAEALGPDILDREGGEELEFLVEAVGGSRPIDGPDQGFCLFTAAVALQTLARDDGFEVGLRRVVGLGGDTDTNAAVAGALLGARDGRDGLPPAWLERLQDRAAIEAEGLALAVLASRT
jgi:ADP-ribosyl-[dinitrogen reductase] hydrolase